MQYLPKNFFIRFRKHENNRSMKLSFLLLSAILLISRCVTAQNLVVEKSSSPLTIGETVTIYSEVLDEDRVINVYLPLGYSEDSLKNYPIIYLLDGSMDEDFVHIAGLVQFGSFSWINMLPQTIVIGIANVDRKRDFTYPTSIEQDKKDFPTTGKSEEFISFLETELKPFVQSKYRVNDTSTIIGQSLGGLLATEILVKRPHLFDNYIIVSPSLWWDDGSLFEHFEELTIKNKSIFIAVGKEGDIMEHAAKKLHESLKKVCGDSVRLYYEFFEDSDHGDVLHLAVYSAFEQIFQEVKPE